MPKPTKTATVVRTAKMTVTKSVVAGIGIVSASVLVITFISAILSPFTMKAFESKPMVSNIFTLTLNEESAQEQVIPRFAKNFEFLKFDIMNHGQQVIAINSLYFNKMGNVADRSVGELQLFEGSSLVATSPRIENGRAYFKNLDFKLDPFGEKTLALKATVVLSGIQPEGGLGFSVKTSGLEVTPEIMNKSFLDEVVKGKIMKVKN